MSSPSSFHDPTRALLIALVALVLAAASSSASAQSSTDDSELKCSATLIAGLVETSGMAYCRGYLGRSCVGEQYANACNEGALARSRRGEAGTAQGSESQAQEMEEGRRLVEQLPRLPIESNPLLGRWRRMHAPSPDNLFESLAGLGSDAACALIAGDGQFFEFRADALVHGARPLDSMRYYLGKEGVVFALGERHLRLLAFEFDGRDRVTNGICRFERVGAITISSSSSPPQAAVQPAQASLSITYAPVDPRSALGQGIALHRGKDFQPALQQLLAATTANPDDARGWVFLADTYRWLGLERDGDAALARALRLDPNALNLLR